MTQAIHYIDLLQWFMGEPVEVSAKAGAFVLSDVIEVEDTAAAIITFSSGAIATLSATVTAAPSLGTRITITGSPRWHRQPRRIPGRGRRRQRRVDATSTAASHIRLRVRARRRHSRCRGQRRTATPPPTAAR